MKENEINKRMKEKIDTSDLDINIKKLLYKLIEFEIDAGKNNTHFTKFYQINIDTANIIIKRSAK